MFGCTISTHSQFLKATQNATVRLDKELTSAEILGLCTDALRPCLALIIKDKDNKRISLTHTDGEFDTKSVLIECEWVGDSAEIILIRGIFHQPRSEFDTTYNTHTLPRLRLALSASTKITDINFVPRPCWAVSIDRTGKIECFDQMRDGSEILLGKCVSNIGFRHAINIINATLLAFDKKKFHPLDLQFDGSREQVIPQLLTEGVELIKKREPSTSYDFITILSLKAEIARYLECTPPLSEAVTAFKAEDYLSALSIFLAHYLRDSTSKEKDEQTILSYNLGSTYKRLNDLDNAILYLIESYRLRLSKLGPAHELTIKTKTRLDECVALKKASPEEKEKMIKPSLFLPTTPAPVAPTEATSGARAAAGAGSTLRR